MIKQGFMQVPAELGSISEGQVLQICLVDAGSVVGLVSCSKNERAASS